MLKYFLIVWIISLSFLMYSCSKEQRVCCGPPDPELFIFGTYFGHCQGEHCVKMFKIENEKLFEDTLDIIPYQDFLTGMFVQLPDSSYQRSKILFQKIPQFLFNENKHVYGCPDCGDWGGMYLEIKIGSVHRSWLIDLKDNSLPTDLITLKDEVVRIVNEIH